MNKVLILFLSIFIFNDSSFADKLAKVSSDTLEFSLESKGNEYKLYIAPKSDLNDKSLTANVFPVKNPSRLVIDIPEFAAGGQKNLTLKDSHVSGIRLGVHNNKTRFVIDIKDKVVPDYDIVADEETGRLIASFSFDESIEPIEEEQKEIIVEATPRPTPVPDIKIPTPKATQIPTPKPTPAPTLKATPKPIIDNNYKESGTISIKPTPETFVMRGNEEIKDVDKVKTNTKSSAKGSLINNILFQAPKDSPLGAIVIEGDNIGEYQLDQKGKNLYELNIKNSKLAGDHLSLPQFPPATFKGFEVILANQEGSDVLLKIYVNQDVKIKPSNAKGKLWLKADK